MSQSVCLSSTSLSKALNLHLFLTGLSQICLRSVSGHSLGSLAGQSQVSLRSVLGPSWVSLSVPTSSDRQSLKYFVLLF